MNACFYLAIDRLPLGTVAAIEFLPVIVLAAIGAAQRAQRRGARDRRARRVPAHRRADRGRAARPRARLRERRCSSRCTSCSPTASRSAAGLSGIDGLAASMLVAARRRDAARRVAGARACSTTRPRCWRGSGSACRRRSSPTSPTSSRCARLARATYALLVSLLPATATVIGIVVLAQVPTRGGGPRRRARRRGRRAASFPRTRAGVRGSAHHAPPPAPHRSSSPSPRPPPRRPPTRRCGRRPRATSRCASFGKAILRCDMRELGNPARAAAVFVRVRLRQGVRHHAQRQARASGCASATRSAGPGTPTVQYGTTWRRNGFRCRSSGSGVRCTNARRPRLLPAPRQADALLGMTRPEGTNVLKWILVFGVVTTGLHFTHNFVAIEDYPASTSSRTGSRRSAIVVSWPLFTYIAIRAFQRYAGGDVRGARTGLHRLRGVVALLARPLHEGNPDIPPFFYATIFTDVLAGALVAGFVVWSMREQPADAVCATPNLARGWTSRSPSPSATGSATSSRCSTASGARPRRPARSSWPRTRPRTRRRPCSRPSRATRRSPSASSASPSGAGTSRGSSTRPGSAAARRSRSATPTTSGARTSSSSAAASSPPDVTLVMHTARVVDAELARPGLRLAGRGPDAARAAARAHRARGPRADDGHGLPARAAGGGAVRHAPAVAVRAGAADAQRRVGPVPGGRPRADPPAGGAARPLPAPRRQRLGRAARRAASHHAPAEPGRLPQGGRAHARLRAVPRGDRRRRTRSSPSGSPPARGTTGGRRRTGRCAPSCTRPTAGAAGCAR